MSAITIGFPLPGSGEPVILIGFDHPIHEHLEACQHWAGTEVTPVAGLAKLEVWTAQGVKSRFSLPENAPVDTQYAHLLEPSKQESIELLERLQAAVARVAELEALVGTKDDGDSVGTDSQAAQEELPVLSLPADGGPATPKKKPGKAE